MFDFFFGVYQICSLNELYNTAAMDTPPGRRRRGTGMPRPHADAVLGARENHPGATLADLYDLDLMPPDLCKARQALGRAVDRIYRPGGFASERERVEHLFMLYEKMRAPLEAGVKMKRRGRG